MKVNNHYANPRIGVTSPSFSKNEALKKELLRAFPDSVFCEGRLSSSHEVIEFLQGCQGAVIGLEPVTAEVFDRLESLRVIGKYGVGLNNVDLEAAKNKGVCIGWTGGVNRRSVSELTLAFMLGLARNVFQSGFRLKNGVWEKDGGYQLTGKTVGIVGCGYAGEDVIRLLEPFHCSILGNDILDKRGLLSLYGGRQVNIETIFKESDIVTLHVPLTERTSGFIGKDLLAMMKKDAFLINTSRGEVLDQNALKSALKNNSLAGAGLDVFAVEPPDDPEFLTLPNLMVTPHIGGNAREAVFAMGMAAIRALVNFFEGDSVSTPNGFVRSGE